jgi:hypothetical protein
MSTSTPFATLSLLAPFVMVWIVFNPYIELATSVVSSESIHHDLIEKSTYKISSTKVISSIPFLIDHLRKLQQSFL